MAKRGTSIGKPKTAGPAPPPIAKTPPKRMPPPVPGQPIDMNLPKSKPKR